MSQKCLHTLSDLRARRDQTHRRKTMEAHKASQLFLEVTVFNIFYGLLLTAEENRQRKRECFVAVEGPKIAACTHLHTLGLLFNSGRARESVEGREIDR